jgi:hypothetical protein
MDTHANVDIYTQAKLWDAAGAKEDLLANPRLLADLVGSSEIGAGIDDLETQLESLASPDISKAIGTLQRQALKIFVGLDQELTEETLRAAITNHFGISFIEQPRRQNTYN